MSFLEKNTRKIVFLLFFISGIAGLMYEIIWMRRMILVFGGTSMAVSTVISVYLGGLALGAFIFGKWIDRRKDPLRVFGLLVIITGLYALALPLFSRGVMPVYTLAYRIFGVNFAVLTIVRFLLSTVTLIVPATLMGGTLPVLSYFMSRHPATLRINLSRLYALNTLGAVLGCFLSGFVFLPRLGLIRTTIIAALIDILAGVIALMLYRETSRETEWDIHSIEELNITKVAPVSKYPLWLTRLIIFLFALSGFAALAYEVFWTRLLIYYVRNNVYAFTIMLTVFLLGISLGSFIFEIFFKRVRRLILVFSVIELLIGILAVVSIAVMISLRFHDLSLRWATPFWNASLSAILKAVIVMGPITVLLGIAFPLVNTIYASSERGIGSGVGTAYFANTIGAILGSISAGFVITPLIGTRLGIISIATMNIIIAFTIAGAYFLSIKKTLLIPILVIACVFIVATPIAGSRFFPVETYANIFEIEKEGKITYLRESIGGTVTIEEFPAYRTISINGVNVAGTNKAFHMTQKLQAHLAILLHPNPENILQIGFGSGGTAFSASTHDIENIDCVEISPVVLEAAPKFHETNKGVLENPRVKVFIDDARSFVRHSGRQYDIILSDSTHPIIAGNGALYTVDYFRHCYNSLKDDGIFSTWLPLYDLRAYDYKVILKSLKEVFPHVYVWHSSVGMNEWTIVHGFKNKMLIDYSSIQEQMSHEKVMEDLKSIFIEKPEDLLNLFVTGDDAVGIYISDVDIVNTDENAWIEFVPTRYAVTGSRTLLFREAFAELMHFRYPVQSFLTLPPDNNEKILNELARQYRSTTVMTAGRLFWLWDQNAIGEQLFLRSIEISPANKVAMDLLGVLDENRDEILARQKVYPDDAHLEVDLGHHYFMRGDNKTARKHYECAIEMDPENEYAYSRSVHASIRLGDYDETIETTRRWQSAVLLPTTNEAIMLYRNIIYCERERTYREDDVELISFLATKYSEILDLITARNLAIKGLNIEKDNAELLETLCYVQRILLDAELTDTLTRLLEIDPSNRIGVETVRLMQGDPMNPYVFFNETRRRMEEETEKRRAHLSDFDKGMMAWSNADYDTALDYFEKAISGAVFIRDSFFAYGKICLFKGYYDKGIRMVDRALTLFRNDSDFDELFSILKFRQALHNKLVETADDYIRGALVYLQAGRLEEGLPYLLKGLEINPEADYGAVNLGSYYMLTGQLEKARDTYNRAFEMTPNDERLRALIKSLDERFQTENRNGSGIEIPEP